MSIFDITAEFIFGYYYRSIRIFFERNFVISLHLSLSIIFNARHSASSDGGAAKTSSKKKLHLAP